METSFLSGLLDVFSSTVMLNNFNQPNIIPNLVLLSLVLVVLSGIYLLLREGGTYLMNPILRTHTLSHLNEPARVFIRFFRAGLTLLFILLFLISLGLGLFKLYQGHDLKNLTLQLLERIPDKLLIELAATMSYALILGVVAHYLIKFIGNKLDMLKTEALAYKELRSNDASLHHFFSNLKTIVTVSIWLLALYTLLHLSPFPDYADNALLILKVYLVTHVALLIVSAVTAIVDSLDALSKRLAESNDLLLFYNKLSRLIPLLHKTLEYIIYVGAATLVLELTDFVPSLAQYGPGIIQAIGLIFLARVVIELLGLLIDRALIREEQTVEERQKNLTVLPIIKSVLNGVVYFITLILILKGIGFDPIPLLAGAGILSMVIGFGAQSLINDLLSGFFVIFEGQYKVGDFVEVSNARGSVEKITLRITAIRNPDGQLHILRNGKVEELVNYSHQYTNAVVKISVDPKHELKNVFDALINIGQQYAEESNNILEPTVVRGVEDISGSEVVISTQTKVKPGTHLIVARELKLRFTEGLAKAGMEIPFKDRNTAMVIS